MRQEAITHSEECYIPPALIHRSELMLTRLKGIHQQNWLNPIDTTDFNRFPFNNFTYCLTLFPKCFSSFPHGTCSLSVMHEYLGLESGLPMFRQDFTCPALLKDNDCSTRKGLSPSMADFSKSFRFIHHCHWPGPRSLATTYGVSVDVLSCRYLDVSVPCVRFLPLCIRK